MPARQIDRRAVKTEARELIKTASVSPLKLMALFLLLCLALDEISTAADWFFQTLAPYDLSAFPPVLPRLGTDSLSLLFVSILMALLGTVLRAGFAGYCLGVHRGRAMPYASLFDAFPFAGKVIFLTFLEGLLAGLGFMFFVVPGVYVLLTYSFALFHLCEDPDAGVFAAMRRSREETLGYKGQLLFLFLSFVPLLLLVCVPAGLCILYLQTAFPMTLAGELLYTLASGVVTGLASLYTEPCIQLAKVGFYRRATEPPAEEPGEELSAEPSENEENRLD